MKVELHRDALHELSHAVDWYERDYAGRGVRFRVAIERVLERIAAAPNGYAERLGARAANVARFPYVVIFSVEDDIIRVLAVAHTKRRPKYWQKRR